MRKRDTQFIEVFAGAVFLIVVFYIIRDYGGEFGLTASIGNDMFAYFPGVFFIFVAMLGVGYLRGTVLMPIVFILGIGIALLVGTANTQGLITDAVLGGLTLVQTQELILLVSGVCGALAAGVTR